MGRVMGLGQILFLDSGAAEIPVAALGVNHCSNTNAGLFLLDYNFSFDSIVPILLLVHGAQVSKCQDCFSFFCFWSVGSHLLGKFSRIWISFLINPIVQNPVFPSHFLRTLKLGSHREPPNRPVDFITCLTLCRCGTSENAQSHENGQESQFPSDGHFCWG